MTKHDDQTDKPWLNFYGPRVPETISYDNRSIPGDFIQAVKDFPDRTALHFKGHRVSYARLLHMVNVFCCCLKKFGVKKGDCVGIALPGEIASVVAFYATLKIGGVVVMMNPDMPEEELLFQLNDSDIKVVVTRDIFADHMISLRKKSKVQRVVYTAPDDHLSFFSKKLYALIRSARGQAPRVSPARDLYAWAAILAERPLIVGAEAIHLSAPALVQYTEAAEGRSRGVILTHGNLSHHLQQLQVWFPEIRPGQDKLLAALPFDCPLGLAFVMTWTMIKGWEMVLCPSLKAGNVLRTIKKTRPAVTVFDGPTMIDLVKHPDFRRAGLSFITHCFSGNAPLPASVLTAFEERAGVGVVQGYGLPETTAITHIQLPSENKRKPGSIGIPISDTLCRLVDPTDPKRDVPVGSRGALLIKGPQIMRGYRGKGEGRARVLSGGWFYTGEVAHRDEEGFFYRADQMKETQVSEDLRVYPREIEALVIQHPKVSEVCTIGVPDGEKEDLVKLFVVLKKGESASPDEFIRFCKERIDPCRCPSQVEIREELPRLSVEGAVNQKMKDEAPRRSHSL